MRMLRVLPLASLALLSACPGRTVSPDGSIDASPDVGDAIANPDVNTACTEVTPIHSLYPGPLYVTAGGTQNVMLRLARDRSICAADYTLTVDQPGVLTAPQTVHMDLRHGNVQFSVTGGTVGTTMLHATQTTPGAPSATVAIPVVVQAPAVPSCPASTVAATGHLAPGATVQGTAGTPLAAASIAMPMLATDAPLDVTIGCAADQVPTGFDAVGPAVTFGPGAPHFLREMPVTIPINPSLVPAFLELQTEIAYTGPGLTTPRIVAMSNTRFTQDGTGLQFNVPRMGTYQAVIAHGLGTRSYTRHYVYRAILGVSMGGLGSSMMAMRHPDLFDFAAPLGGPADWGFFGHLFHDYLIGGFCTSTQRAQMGDAACGVGNDALEPPVNDYFIAHENFEWFNYPDGRGGQGGTFDRQEYVQIFRDLTHMFGNPLMPTDPANGIVPLGIPASEIARTDADRCATPLTLNNFYDDEYNPDGSHPVITFCDGIHVDGHAGEFQPGQGNYPFELGLAVDLNANGIRDPGEPVIRDLAEPFQDVGTDGLADAQEPHYNVATNPDPNGDDYDRQYNPGGTEGNYLYEAGEPYQDVGLDGMACPVASCPYDMGEGNGHFDTSPGLQGFISHNAGALYAALPSDAAHRLSVWSDGGTRDLFNFGAVADHFGAGLAEQNRGLHIYNNFSGLIARVPVNPNSDDPMPPQYPGFNFTEVDYAHLPEHLLLRYGFVDASMADLVAGDGGHVGTTAQITNRLFSSVWWNQARWSGLDRTLQANSTIVDNDGMCAHGNVCSFNFTSPTTGRTGPVSIYLPPGYHDPANAAVTYPVLYVLHGYGMQPSDLLASGILIGGYMSSGNMPDWQRPGKFIMVFPDGRCRTGDGCLNGSFYVDSPNPGNAQIETYFLDLYHFVETTYRARQPDDVTITE